MRNKAIVTEDDFRCQEFKGKDPADYEFRGDGKIVRKDRWEMGIRKIHAILFNPRSDFEIEDIINAVKELKEEVMEITQLETNRYEISYSCYANDYIDKIFIIDDNTIELGYKGVSKGFISINTKELFNKYNNIFPDLFKDLR